MYKSVSNSKYLVENDLHKKYIKNIIHFGNIILNKFNYGFKENINRADFIRNKILLDFDNNLTVQQTLFTPQKIDKLFGIAVPERSDIVINNIVKNTEVINNYYQNDDGELVENNW